MSDITISRADAEAIETLILESLSDADRDQAAALPGSSMEQAATAELRLLKPLLARIQAAAAPRPAEEADDSLERAAMEVVETWGHIRCDSRNDAPWRQLRDWQGFDAVMAALMALVEDKMREEAFAEDAASLQETEALDDDEIGVLPAFRGQWIEPDSLEKAIAECEARGWLWVLENDSGLDGEPYNAILYAARAAGGYALAEETGTTPLAALRAAMAEAEGQG